MCTGTAISYPKHQISPIIRIDRGMGLRLAADHVDPLISDVDFFFLRVGAILVAPMLIFFLYDCFCIPLWMERGNCFLEFDFCD